MICPLLPRPETATCRSHRAATGAGRQFATSLQHKARKEWATESHLNCGSRVAQLPPTQCLLTDKLHAKADATDYLLFAYPVDPYCASLKVFDPVKSREINRNCYIDPSPLQSLSGLPLAMQDATLQAQPLPEGVCKVYRCSPFTLTVSMRKVSVYKDKFMICTEAQS